MDKLYKYYGLTKLFLIIALY
nr:hypothetical protein [Trichormus azollae]